MAVKQWEVAGLERDSWGRINRISTWLDFREEEDERV